MVPKYLHESNQFCFYLDVLVGNESFFALQNDKHYKQKICYI